VRWGSRLALPVIAVAAVTFAVWASTRAPDGPVEPRWDHERCARCSMLISEPRFAAQLQRDDGRVLHYDDPGCLLLHEGEERGALADAHAVWFHHASEPRWLSLGEVGFVPVANTPMDFGFGAVDRTDRAGALAVDVTEERIRARAEGQP